MVIYNEQHSTSMQWGIKEYIDFNWLLLKDRERYHWQVIWFKSIENQMKQWLETGSAALQKINWGGMIHSQTDSLGICNGNILLQFIEESKNTLASINFYQRIGAEINDNQKKHCHGMISNVTDKTADVEWYSQAVLLAISNEWHYTSLNWESKKYIGINDFYLRIEAEIIDKLFQLQSGEWKKHCHGIESYWCL